MTTFQTSSTVWRDKVTDGVYSSDDHMPQKPEIRAWAAWVESGISAGTLNGPWEATLAALNAKLAYGDGNPGFVYEGADFGTYRKSGASGAGSWVKIFSFIPGYQFVKATDAGSGTANAIVATSSPPISYTDGAQTILTNISTTNTSTTVTINFDGLGALSVKTASGADPAIGSLTANMVVRGTIQASATEFRLDSNLSMYANFDHQGDWSAVVTYTENQVVTGSDGYWYQLKTASALNDNPVSGGSGDWLSILSSTGIADESVTPVKLSSGGRASLLVNAIRAAESSIAGVSLDGKAFVDLLCSNTTLNLAGSTNYQFRRGGIEPTSAPGTAATAATVAVTGTNSGWQNQTVGVTVAAAQLSNTGKSRLRATFKSGTGGQMEIQGAFVGVIDTDGVSFKKSYPVVPLLFSAGAYVTATGGASVTSDWAEFEIPASEKIGVFWYMKTTAAALRYLADKAAETGYTMYYKTANEPARYTKTGYSSLTSRSMGLEKIEVTDIAYDNMSLVSGELPLSTSAASADAVLFLDCASGDVANFALSVSRDGATWKAVTLGSLYTVNGKIGRSAYGIDLSTGAGTGSSLYWKAVTSSNKAIKLNALSLFQTAGTFTDVPSVDMRESDPLVSHHFEATGLGVGASGVSYGRLWGFTQDWDRTGPTRYKVRFHCNIVHNGGTVATSPIAWTLPGTRTHAATLAALGAKDYTETDTSPATGNNALKWFDFDSGNIANVEEHYKTGYINLVVDVEDDGADRFEIWGFSETSADSGVSGHISVNHEEAYGASNREFKYNKLEITAQVLR